ERTLFQHRTLFDVQLEEGADVGAFLDHAGMPADLGNALPQRHAHSLALQPLNWPLTGHAATADAGDAEDRHLLGKEVHDLEVVLEDDALFLEGPRHLQRRHHAGDAVEAAAVGHGVGMAAEHDGAGARAAAGAAPDEVAGGVDPRFQSRLPKAIGEVLAPLEEDRREGAPGPGAVRFGDLRQRLDI